MRIALCMIVLSSFTVTGCLTWPKEGDQESSTTVNKWMKDTQDVPKPPAPVVEPEDINFDNAYEMREKLEQELNRAQGIADSPLAPRSIKR